MAELERTFIHGITCDGTRCIDQIVGELMDAWPDGRDHYRALADAAGWTFWAGTRTSRTFCPGDKPSRGAALDRVDAVSRDARPHRAPATGAWCRLCE